MSEDLVQEPSGSDQPRRDHPMICSVPECQTPAGCQCNSPYVVSVRKIWSDENASLRSRISELEAALEPFIASPWPQEIADALWGDVSDTETMTITLPLGAYRRARAVQAPFGSNEPLCDRND